MEEQENKQLKEILERLKELFKEHKQSDGWGEWQQGYDFCLSEIKEILGDKLLAYPMKTDKDIKLP